MLEGFTPPMFPASAIGGGTSVKKKTDSRITKPIRNIIDTSHSRKPSPPAGGMGLVVSARGSCIRRQLPNIIFHSQSRGPLGLVLVPDVCAAASYEADITEN